MVNPEIKNAIIVPANGALGSALGKVFFESHLGVTFVFRDCDKALDYGRTFQIERLKGVVFPDKIRFTADAEQAIKNADLIVLATPTKYLPSYYREQVMPFRKEETPVLSVAKGLVIIDNQHLRPSEALLNIDPSLEGYLAVLSGPNFALEIAAQKPFATVIASKNPMLAESFVEIFARNPLFKIYPSTDVTGVELGGAFKNVIAIAAGVCDGKQYGESARAALIERGKVEIVNLGVALGGQRETLAEGLSGDANLWMTCTSKLSRNHEYGVGIGQGWNPRELLQKFKEDKKTVEGFETTKITWRLARQKGIRTPVIDSVFALLHRHVRLDKVIEGLMGEEFIYENGKPLKTISPIA